ncbi:hypothetical protein [Paenibacillus hamazuiensis]|uniref:hypothetical protein n=1 Tax=Paenibacillus hamazuiensis TaxID=2936508 RepID=UPI00200C9D9D|nr:hypothetical protein [Paenibacillus hamazuiensis]
MNDDYEHLLQEKALLSQQIMTIEEVKKIIFDAIEQRGHQLHVLTLEDILISIHSLSSNLQMELLLLHLDKALAAYK